MVPCKEDTPPQPWKPAAATNLINTLARGEYELIVTNHARSQLSERQLLVGDAMYVLKNGHVYIEPETSTRKGFFKYRIESASPNSNSRTVRVVVIPSCCEKILKIITVMWRDEAAGFGNAR
jgi:hypothetical protein